MAAPRRLGVTEGYDAWAPTYNADGNPLIAVEEACGAVRSVAVAGRTVLDIGTGTGRNVLPLLDRGAAAVVGIDGSAGMLRRARAAVEHYDGPGRVAATMVHHDLLKTPWPLPPSKYDVVLCSLVLEHLLPRQLPRFFGEVARVCRRGGTFLMTVQHPGLNASATTARFSDPAGGQVVVGDVPSNRASDYIAAGLEVGFTLTAMGEHGPSDFEGLSDRVPRAKKYVGVLTVLVLCFVRGGPLAKL